jgi:hypothetical protein
MKNATELLLEFTASSFQDPKKAAAIVRRGWRAFEMPYLADFGFPPRYAAQQEIADFFQRVRDLYPGFEFENVKVLIDTPTQTFRFKTRRVTACDRLSIEMPNWEAEDSWIRRCGNRDFELIWAIINDDAEAYKGIMPADRWVELYMSREKLRREIADGVGVLGIRGERDAGRRHGHSAGTRCNPHPTLMSALATKREELERICCLICRCQ